MVLLEVMFFQREGSLTCYLLLSPACLGSLMPITFFVWGLASQLVIVARSDFRNVSELCFIHVNRCQTKYHLNMKADLGFCLAKK